MYPYSSSIKALCFLNFQQSEEEKEEEKNKKIKDYG